MTITESSDRGHRLQWNREDAYGKTASQRGWAERAVDSLDDDLLEVFVATARKLAVRDSSELVFEVGGIGGLEHLAHALQKAGRATEGCEESGKEGARKLTALHADLDPGFPAKKFNKIMLLEVWQRLMVQVGLAERGRFGQVATGDDDPRALCEVLRGEVVKVSEVGIGDSAGFEVQRFLEVVKH